MSNDLPYLHGAAHRPGGSDPTLPGIWMYAAAAAAAWSGGTTYNPGDIVSHDVFNYQALIGSTGVEPSVTSGWPSSWVIYQSIFQNGWTNIGGSSVPLRFGIVLGQLNQLDRLTGAITQYNLKRLDYEGDIMGGLAGVTVIWLPPAYRDQYDVPIHAHDDNKLYIAGRSYTAGNVVLDVP